MIGNSELDHSVSELYTRPRDGGPLVVRSPRTGIAAVAEASAARATR